MHTSPTALSKPQEDFYNHLFDGSYPRFHESFFRTLFQTLYYTYGLPAEIKCRVRQGFIATLMENGVKRYAVDYKKRQDDRLKALSSKAREELSIKLDEALYAELQKRLELAINARVTDADNADDDAQCLQMHHDLQDKLTASSALFIFVYEEIISAGAELLRSFTPKDSASENAISKLQNVALPQALKEGVLTFANAPITITRVASTLGLLNNVDSKNQFLRLFIAKLAKFSEHFDAVVEAVTAITFPSDAQIAAYTKLLQQTALELVQRGYLTVADVMEPSAIAPVPAAIEKKKPRGKKGARKRGDGGSVTAVAASVIAEDLAATEDEVTDTGVEHKAVPTAETDTTAVASGVIMAPDANAPAMGGAGDVSLSTETEESGARLAPAVFKHVKPTGQKRQMLNPKGKSLFVIGDQVVTVHRRLEFPNPLASAAQLASRADTLVYDSDPEPGRHRRDVIPMTRTLPNLFALVAPSVREALSLRQNTRLTEHLEYSRVGVERDLLVAKPEGDLRVAAKRDGLIATADGTRASLAVFNIVGKHTGSGRSTIFGSKP